MDDMTLADLAAWLFMAFNGLRLVSYLPQICRVARDPNGASAISYTTWALWTGAHASTGLYASTNLDDAMLTGFSAVYATCCASVIALTAVKRRQFLARRGAGALWTAHTKT